MEKINKFKEFVRQKPELISHVNGGKTTWQKLYETWDLYGENNDVWRSYDNPSTVNTAATAAATAAAGGGLMNIFNNLKNVNIDSVSKGLDGLQRVLGTIREFTSKDSSSTPSEPYIPRPVHRYFDD